MKLREWHTWFAWYPIAFGPFIRFLWPIQRKWIALPGADRGYYVYRRNRKEFVK